MAYCKNCGKEIDNKAYICIHCGVRTYNDRTYIDYYRINTYSSNSGTTLGIIGLCFALFIPLVGWICGGIGLYQSTKSYNSTGKAISLTSIILASISFILYVILLSV